MTDRPIVGGIRFLSSVALDDASDDGFSDLDITVEWTPKDEEVPGQPVAAPLGLTVWVGPEDATIHLPIIHENTVAWSWQLRQVAPIVAAWHSRLTIHASAVSIDDRVVAFVGGSGAGKSTIAWELVKAGATPVVDDLLPVRFGGTPHTVRERQLAPISRIIFLSRAGTEPEMAAVASVDAFTRHLENGFGEHKESRIWAYQFDAYHQLAQEVNHYTLTVPDDRERIPEMATWLVDEIAGEDHT